MHVWILLQHTMIVVYVLRRTTVHKGYVTPLLLSSVLFVNSSYALHVRQRVKKRVLEPMFKIKNFFAPRYYGHQFAIPRMSAITGVDFISLVFPQPFILYLLLIAQRVPYLPGPLRS